MAPDAPLEAQAQLLAALSNDTASISALRCLKLYLERISGDAALPAGQVRALAGARGWCMSVDAGPQQGQAAGPAACRPGACRPG